MEIKEKIRQFIMEELKQLSEDGNVDYLEDDTSLIESGLVDSMMILSLLAFLEENFNVFLSKDEFNPENFGTVIKISEMVAQKISKS
jgi:acyl carrier protein